MKNIILAIMFVFSVVWSQDASARAPKHKKPTVAHKRTVKKAKKGAESSGYRSSYLRKKRNRSVASESPSTKKSKKHSAAKKTKKKRKHSH